MKNRWKAHRNHVIEVDVDGNRPNRGQRSTGDPFPMIGYAFTLEHARLFAASMDLLDACTAVLDENRYVNHVHPEIVAELKAAIAKATATVEK